MLCYCGIDQALWEMGRNFMLLEERISDTAIHRYLKFCLTKTKLKTHSTIILAVHRTLHRT